MRKNLVLLFALALTACSFAPKYQRPPMQIPNHYKETGTWINAKPSSANLDKGSWWCMYEDSTLNQLEAKVLSANQNIQAAVARYDEARAILAVQRAALYPNILGVFNANRQQLSNNLANPPPNNLYSDNLLVANLNYQVDVWGLVRNSIANAKNLAEASAADLATIDLSMHAELAQDYFLLRGKDREQAVLDKTVAMYEKALYLTQQRHKGGAISAIDEDQARSQLEAAKSLAEDTRLKRAQLEHAIAVLIGEVPAAFSLPPAKPHAKWVTIAPIIPSSLLERRPDVAAAERKVQAANAKIGAARAAFFPVLNLAAVAGYESAAFSNLVGNSSSVWALGPTSASALLNDGSLPLVTQTIFDGGRLIALSKQASAQYYETVANYRQTVLTAFQEVEDNLVALRQLDQENITQTKAMIAADKAATQAMFRYRGGLTTYLDVVVIQNTALQSALSTIDIRTRRHVASVQLIKALGGGYINQNL